MKLLLVEDEKRMVQALSELLRQEHYEVDSCTDGPSGLAAAEGGLYDLIVLDVMLPGMDGFAVARALRRQGIRTPILMLTAKGGLDDTVEGLDSGALVRRNLPSGDGTLSFGDISLDADTASLVCTSTSQNVRLSEKEYRILEYFIANQNQILTREQLAVKIWGFENDAEYNKVEVYLSFTRRKLAFVGSKTVIKAVRGIGYELRCENV